MCPLRLGILQLTKGTHCQLRAHIQATAAVFSGCLLCQTPCACCASRSDGMDNVCLSGYVGFQIIQATPQAWNAAITALLIC